MSKTFVREDGYTFVWNGSKTVNIYSPFMREVDVFSLDYGRDDHTMSEVIAIAKTWEVNA